MSIARTTDDRVALAAGRHDVRDGHRARMERLLALAEALPDEDRLLVRQVYEIGLTIAEIARQAERPRGRIHRRLQGILRRMRRPLFRYVAAHRAILPVELRRVAELKAIHGLSGRRIAAITRQTQHAVRFKIEALRALAQM